MKTAHLYTHLGQAPYSLVGYEYDPRVETAMGFQGGTHACDHCGRGIVHVFFIRSTDGKEFTLGSEHAKYLGDDGLVANVKAKMAELRREAREDHYRELRQAEAARQSVERQKLIQQVKADFERVLPKLKSAPHPNTYFAGKGKTMLDYAEYCCGDLSKREDDFWYYNSKIKQIIKEVA